MVGDIDKNNEQDRILTVVSPAEGNLELTVNCKEIKTIDGQVIKGQLSCSCGISLLAGIPCAHELGVCKQMQLEPKSALRFKPRWFLKY